MRLKPGSEAWLNVKEAYRHFLARGEKPSTGAVDRRACYVSKDSPRSHPFSTCSECHFGKGATGDRCLQGETMDFQNSRECHRFSPRPGDRPKELLINLQKMIERGEFR